MKAKYFAYVIAVALVVVAAVWYSKDKGAATSPDGTGQTMTDSTPSVPGSSTGSTDATNAGKPKFTLYATPLPVYYAQQIASTTLSIHVAQPIGNTAIATPLSVGGEARGNWFFEASFPVTLTDADRRIIASGIAQAKSDWMTTDFVPFASTFSFPKQKSGSKGYLILRKDNPSGLTQNDAAVEIQVTFQ